MILFILHCFILANNLLVFFYLFFIKMTFRLSGVNFFKSVCQNMYLFIPQPYIFLYSIHNSILLIKNPLKLPFDLHHLTYLLLRRSIPFSLVMVCLTPKISVIRLQFLLVLFKPFLFILKLNLLSFELGLKIVF